MRTSDEGDCRQRSGDSQAIGKAPRDALESTKAGTIGALLTLWLNGDWEEYWRELVELMAQYILAHGDNYEHITTFTESRYGEIMNEAKKLASVDFRILPVSNRPEIIQGGKYWDRYWIQLYLEIVGWLDPSEQAQADKRLREMNVPYMTFSARNRKGL